MMKPATTILGVNPGSKYLGLAVFQGPVLEDWRTKVFRGQWSSQKSHRVQRVIHWAMERYNPQVLAIKQLHPARSSRKLDGLTRQIEKMFQQKGLQVQRYTVQQLEAFFSPEKEINKRQLSEFVTAHYPDLFSELHREAAAKNPYYIRMFEAVALGALCAHQLDKNNRAMERKTRDSLHPKQNHAHKKYQNPGH